MTSETSKTLAPHRIMQVVKSTRLMISADCTKDGGTRDGYVAFSSRDSVVDRSNVLPAGQAQRLALVSDAGWGDVCRRPSHGLQLVACGWPEQGLPGRLLFPVQHRPESPNGRRLPAQCRTVASGSRRTSAAGARRYGDQTIWPSCRRGGNPPQSHAGTGRPNVCLRARLGHPLLARPSPVVGDDRLASGGQIVRARQGRLAAVGSVWLAVSDQARTRGGTGGVGRSMPALAGAVGLDRRGRRLCETTVPAPRAGSRSGAGGAFAQGCGAVLGSRARSEEGPRQASQVRTG